MRNVEDIYPLSPMQRGLLFHTLYAPGTGVYFEQFHCTLAGELDVPTFKRAWQHVVDRHSVLRSALIWDDLDEPLQVVRERVELPWHEEDWRGLVPDDQLARFELLLQADRRRGFELSRAPLMRMALIQIDEGKWRFVWSFHHVLFDGWSVPILLQEVMTFYGGFERGVEAPLERPRPYRDYIAWLQKQDESLAESFWRRNLRGFASPTRLGVERTTLGSAGPTNDYARQQIRLTSRLTEQIQELSRQQGLSINSFVQGAWALLLSRYSGDGDVVFGVTSSGRPPSLPGVESMVGLFVNSLPARVRVSPGSDLLPWLRELQAQQAELRQFEYSSLMQVQAWSEVPRGQSLFDSLFVFENYLLQRSSERADSNVAVHDIGTWSRTNYPLTVIAGAPSDHLSVGISYDRSRFDDVSVTRILGHLGHLLKAMAAAPRSRLSHLSLLDEEELLQVTATWATGSASDRDGPSVQSFFERQTERTPEAVAVVSAEIHLSYGELNQRGNQLASYLERLGVRADVPVAVCLQRSPEMVIGILAILKAGGAYVPLDPEYPPERLLFMLEDARAPLVLTMRSWVERLPKHRAQWVCLDSDWPTIARSRKTDGDRFAAEESLAYIIYTSGSTGRPKGVAMPHRSLNSLLEWQTKSSGFGSARTLQFASLSFDVSFQDIFSTLCSGGALVLVAEEIRRDPAQLLRFLDEEAIERIFVPFVALQQLATSAAGSARALRGPSEIITAGEQLQISEPVARWMNQLGDAVLHNQYGPTETHVVSANALTGPSSDWPALPPIGRPVPNSQLYVLDRDLLPAPIGVPGRLHVGGLCLARGYHDGPGLTAEKFVPHPFDDAPGSRLYDTGDLARWLLDHNLEFLGRADGQVKIRGFRVEPGEIEAVLGAHPVVHQSVVMAREDQPGHRRLVAYLVAKAENGSDAPDIGGLRRFLSTKLPDYMVPSAFVVLDFMPLTPSGKVDRRALPAPEAIRPELESRFVAPRTPVEEKLAEIWSEVLRVDRVGVHDSFFELGGDSILSIQVVTRASQANLRLTPAELFQHPTIAELASVVEAGARIVAEQGPVVGKMPLTPVQHWLFEQELADPHHWNMTLMIELRERLNEACLAGAVRGLVEHHDALRMRFERTTSGWQPWNSALAEWPAEQVFVHVDLRSLPEADQRPALETAAGQLQASLDLTRGPLVRVALFDRAAGPDRLLFVAHHLVVDGVSWRILLQDLLLGYEQLRHGRPIQLLSKTTSFKSWSERLLEYARSDEMLEEIAFWRELARSDVPRLPVDHPSGVNDVRSVETVGCSLDAAETKALLQEVPKAYRTQINDVLLTALVQTLGRFVAAPHLIFDVEGHGREDLFEDVDLSRTVGWFTSMFPVRLDLEGVSGLGPTLKSVKSQLRSLPRRGLGYGLLRYLRGDEELTAELGAVRPEVSFNYLGQFDQALPESAPVGLATESRGPSASLTGRRVHLLDVSGGVGGGQLFMSFMYSRNVHERTTIEGLAADFVDSLRALIAHCRSPEAGGCTPSDFPLVDIDQPTLDSLIGTGRDVEDMYPLSPLQSGLLFHSLYSPGSWEYFEQLTCTLEGDLQVAAFRRAWERVVERHTILRTRIAFRGLKEPLQVVQRQPHLPWEEQDWRSVPAEGQPGRLASLLREDRERGFALDQAPLMRVTLLRLGDDSWRFVWSHHHLLLDGWSLQVLMREVMLCYAGLTMGTEFPLERPRAFRDYIAWLGAQDRAGAERFWRETLGGFTSPTRLGAERLEEAPQRDEEDTYDREQLWLSESSTSALEELGRRYALTPNTLVQGAWAVLLGRYSGERDVLFGTTVSGRSSSLAGIESMLGLFINTLPVRVKLDGNAPILPWLEALQAHQVEMRRHEYSALTDIHGWSDVPRGEPLFESLVIFENYPVERSFRQQPASSLTVRDVHFPQRTNYPLTVVAVPRSKLSLLMLYEGKRFDATTILRMLRQLETLLEDLVRDPSRRVSQWNLLSAPERCQLLVEWNDTGRPFPHDRCLHELFGEQVRARPDAIALVDGDRQVTYGTLDRRSNQLAHRLRAEGIGRGCRVGLSLDRSLELIVGVLGILKAGGAFVPIDPDLPRSRAMFLRRDARIQLVLTQETLRNHLDGEQGRVLYLDTDWPGIAREEKNALPNASCSEDLAYVMYTSGSTGVPKGVEMPHHGAVRLGYGLAPVQLGPQQSVLYVSAPSFDVSIFELWGALLHGGRSVLYRARVPDPFELRDLIGRERVDTAWMTGTLFNAVLDHAPEALRPIRQLLVGGEALSVPHVLRALAEFPDTQLFNGYGPTENAVFTACGPVPRRLGKVRSVPLGGPIANTEVYVLDDWLNPQPVGVPGELHMAGAGVARGYLDRPALTAESFIPNPFGEQPGERLYRSGDRCFWGLDGRLGFLGRVDDQIKLRGFRVELGEIESVLRDHPAVREAAVVADRRPASEMELTAYLVLSEEAKLAPPTFAELVDFVQARLPRYMLPANFHFLSQMPSTSSAKLDRRALSRANEGTATRPSSENYVAPQTALEQELARLWSELLGVEKVGLHDSFFALGGHSLIAMQLVSRVREAFQAEITLREFFEAPTIAELGTAVRRGRHRFAMPPVVPVSREQPLPLSFAQERLWFLDQLMPGNAFYNVPRTVRLTGPLKVSSLRRAVTEIVGRHEALRTTFPAREGRPVQLVAPPGPIPMPVVDLADLAPSARDRETERLSASEAERPFDLSRGPLVRVHLLRTAPSEHVALLNAHHIVCDAWSLTILLREITVQYASTSRGIPSLLPPLSVQYADFAHWQRRWLSGEVRERQLSYWKTRLADYRPLELPTDRPRPAMQSYRGASHSFELPRELRASLEAMSRREGVTAFMTLLTAFQVLLARYAGQEDILVGFPIANRPRTEIEGVVGLFLNTLVIRADLSGDPTLREAVRRVQTTTLEAYDNQDLPFELLVEELVSERDLSREPLIQVLFVMFSPQHVALPEVTGGGELSIETLPLPSKTTKFDLTWFVTAPGFLVEYNVDLFDASTISRMSTHLRNLLEAMVSAPDQRLWELSLLTQAELQQLTVELNATETVSSPDARIEDLLQSQAERASDAVALVFDELHLSYRELAARVDHLSLHLASRGVGPETRVGICMERGPELVVGLLGVLKAGAVYVPLDPDYPGDRLSLMVRDAQIPVLLTMERLAGRLPRSSADLVRLDEPLDEQASQRIPETRPRSSADHLAYIIYTSGTTGRPKGVAMGRGALVNLLRWQIRSSVAGGGKTLQFTSLSFDVSFQEILSTLCAGGTLVLIGEPVRRDPALLLQCMIRNAVERLFAPFVALQQLAETAQDSDLAPATLREILTAGEQLQITPAITWLMQKLPGCTLHDQYGPTESHVVTSFELTGATPEWPTLPPIGRPIWNTRIYILDDRLNPLPKSVRGGLYIAGTALARGYLDRPELTADRFRPDPFANVAGSRMYATGDLARWLPDENLQFFGRADDQVKVRGFRVEPGEVEAALGAHPAVEQAAVLARMDHRGNNRLVAYVVLGREAASTKVLDLRQYLQSQLPDYMVPTSFVVLDAFPLTPSGKVNRRALPPPERTRLELDRAVVAPRNPIEAELARLWSEVLEVDQVGVHDDFFELGGHSLLATQLISRIRQALSVELPLRRLFEAATIARLAEYIQQSDERSAAPSIRPVSRDQRLPLSFAQQRLWFMNQLVPGSAFYNMPWAVRLYGPLDRMALRRSLAEVTARHEILRTTFPAIAGEAYQDISGHVEIGLRVVDLGSLSEPDRERELKRLAEGEALAVFDLARGPLWRCRLIRMSAEDHAVLFTMHHIISDGWSTGVFIGDLASAYEAFRAGMPSMLPALPVQYADFACWQREWLRGAVLEEHLEYWKARLEALPRLRLPTDRPRPQVQSFRGAAYPIAFSDELGNTLIQLSRREGVTLFMTLLAAFQTLLGRYAGQQDVVVGSGVANRTRAELEGLIGFFVNMMVLRTDLSGDPTFTSLLARVREVTLGAYAHQSLPFEKLVDELQPERDLSREPLFQVVFTFQNYPLTSTRLPSGLQLRPLDSSFQTAKFDLTLLVWERAGRLVGFLEYSTDLFDRSTIARLVGHYEALLRGIAQNPDQFLSQLPLASDAERQQLCCEFNDTAKDAPLDRSLPELFEEQVLQRCDAVALVAGETLLSYGELDRRANLVAAELRKRGVGRDERVGVSFPRTLRMVEGFLGVLKAGGAYVPLDVDYPAERLEFMIRDSRIQVLLSPEDSPMHLPEPERSGSSEPRTDGRQAGPAADDLAYVIYTSGSTGQPKGVEVPHRGIVRLLFGAEYVKLAADETFLHLSSTSFDASTFELWGPLLHGARCVLLEDRIPTVERLRQVLSEERVSTMWLTGSLFNLMVDESPQVFASVRQLLVGGEALSTAHVERAQALLADTRIINGYGPTEGTTFTCCYPVPRASNRNWSSIPIGGPIANTSAYLLDGSGNVAPLGVPAELFIGGAGLARGYQNRPDTTAERFVPHPFADRPGARLYRSGDLCRWRSDGTIEFLGRNDHQVKIRGFRIELAEIEAAIREHAGVRNAVVIARDVSDGHRRLVGYLVPDPDYAGFLQGEAAENLERERVSRWREVYDHVIYDQVRTPAAAADPTFNITGWRSSYTGQPLSNEAMEEQIRQTVARIAERHPRRVLEIGCGTGLLLFRIAPQCETYVGTDFSPVALESLSQLVRGKQLSQVTLLQRLADDFDGLEPASFDAVVLNSTVQYFPGVDYLLRVLNGALRLLAPGGFLFIGDVRNLNLLSEFHASVQLHQAPDHLSPEKLLQRVRSEIQAEQELVIAPDFFSAFAASAPQIEGIEIQLKRGRDQNELTQFRYDVVLQLEGGESFRRPAPAPSFTSTDWQREPMTLLEIRRRLEESTPGVWGIRVPNARVTASVAAWQLLSGGASPATVGKLRERLNDLTVKPALDPMDIWALEEGLPYRVSIAWSPPPALDCVDVSFTRQESGAPFGEARPDSPRWGTPPSSPPWNRYANNPMRALFGELLIPRLQESLQRRLPEYMVPSTLVILNELPLTAAGKVDRLAVPGLEDLHRVDDEYFPPRTPAEEQLALLWSELLGVERVGIYDNFFELGGDSIISIQIVARASQMGLQLTPQQVFQHQTLAELAAAASPRLHAAAEPGLATGRAPLTPIQRWFFEQRIPNPSHFNQAVMLDVGQPLEFRALARSVQELVHQHDALRLRFTHDGKDWQQSIDDVASSADSSVLSCLDVSAVSASQRSSTIEAVAAQAQESLDLIDGPLMRVILFETSTQSCRLLVVIHHMAIDGVSWRILLQDMLSGYQQARSGKRPEFPARTTSLRRWAEKLSAHAQSEAMGREAGYWREVVKDAAPSVRVDGEGVNDVGSAETSRVSLGLDETEALLREVPAAYHTQINEVLLTALVQAVGAWNGEARLLLDLEGHGREELFDDVDLSRTVGWFTTIFPARLDLRGVSDSGSALKAIKEQVRGIPNRGIGYGILRYLHDDPGLAAELSVTPAVSFNYLGQFDHVVPEHFLVKVASESSGRVQGASTPRAHWLDVSGAVGAGRLMMTFTYSRNLHRRETIEDLASKFLESLRNLIDHCRSADAGGCTPSDFPLATIAQERLDRLIGRGRDVEDIYPLSPLQSGLLYHSIRDPSAGLHIEQFACTLTGIDLPTFRDAWQQLVDRHAVLRTCFAWEGLDEIVQIVKRRVALPWSELDWRGVPLEKQADSLEDFLQEDRQSGFEPTEAPLMRLSVLRVSADTWRFVWTYHHVLMDGWSLQVLFKELLTFYQSARLGHPIPLERPRPYRDYIAWLGEQDDSAARLYWTRALKGFASPTRLAIERTDVKPKAAGVDHGSGGMALDEAETLALERVARRHGLTLNTVVQGAWAILLARYSGHRDVVFGVTVSGRSAPIEGIGAMIGLFINALPVRLRVSGERELIPWLKSLQEDQAEVRRYEFCSLVRIQSWSDLPAGTPLFENLLAFENYPVDRSLVPQAQGSLQIANVRIEERVNYPLGVIVSPASSMSVRVLFHLDRFRAEDIRGLLGHFRLLLLSLGANPNRRLDELSLLSPEEQEQILVAWNQTSLTVPGAEVSAHEQFEIQARQQPDRVAVVDGERQISYGELNRRANQLAHYLRGLGVGPEVRVGVCLHRSLSMVTGILGILKAGGGYLPLDPDYPEERLAWMTGNAGLSVVVTQRTVTGLLPTSDARRVLVDVDWSTVARESGDDPVTLTTPDNLAYVIYTSGSTGRPKGTLLTHRGLSNLARAQQRQFPLGPGARVLQFASLSFDASTWEFAMALFSGSVLVLARGENIIPGGPLEETLQKEGITIATLPPAVLSLTSEEPSALAVVISAGEQCTKDIASGWARKARFVNAYGPTESTVCATSWEYREDGATVPPIGRPIANSRVYVLDRDSSPVPVGLVGELHVGGLGLARGYLDLPTLTGEKFVPDPLGRLPGARLYKTGDAARWLPDGNLECLGRLDQQVKIRGYRVELGEIETVLAEHPLVRQTVVTLREARNGSPSLVAYLVVAADEDSETPVAAEEFRSFLSKRLPDHMVPSYFELLGSLPLTLSGKVDRTALPPPGGRQLPGYVPPKSPLEATLTEIWAEVMRIERVGVRDDFFELGGHSILAVQLMGRVSEELGQTVPLADFLEQPTIERMAGLLGERPVHPRLVTFKRSVGKRAVFFVHSGSGSVMSYYSLAQRMRPDQPFYGLEPRGLDGRQEPLETIEQMASDYIDAVRSVQPRGPYFLGGHSAGGIVAFEMARQLRAGGDDDVRLLLLDTPSPHFYHEEWAEAVGRRMEVDDELLATVARNFGHPAGQPDDDRIALVLRELQAGGFVPPDAKSIEALLRVSRGIYRALVRYEPPALDRKLRVRLYRAEEDNTLPRDEARKTHSTWGWDALVGEVIVTKVGGDHFSMLTEPHVGPLSGLLTAALEETS